MTAEQEHLLEALDQRTLADVLFQAKATSLLEQLHPGADPLRLEVTRSRYLPEGQI